MAADQGTGTTVAFTSAGAVAFETGVTFIDMSGNISRGAVETTHLGTTVAKSFEPEDLYDGGEITMTIDWDPEEMLISTVFIMTMAPGTVTITFPNADTYAASMFFTGINWGPVAVNQRMQASVTLKVTGAVTIT